MDIFKIAKRYAAIELDGIDGSFGEANIGEVADYYRYKFLKRICVFSAVQVEEVSCEINRKGMKILMSLVSQMNQRSQWKDLEMILKRIKHCLMIFYWHNTLISVKKC